MLQQIALFHEIFNQNGTTIKLNSSLCIIQKKYKVDHNIDMTNFTMKIYMGEFSKKDPRKEALSKCSITGIHKINN